MAKTWAEKFYNGKEPSVQVLDSGYGGMKAGDIMLISSPAEIEAYIRKIPAGKTVTTQYIRQDLAKEHQADGTCPLTTGIFLRIVAELASKQLQKGNDDVAPFWRAIDPSSPLAKKLSVGPDFIRSKLASELNSSPKTK